MSMRIAFFGGSFDPPHRGHLAIARAALARLALDQVWMAPVASQPLKLDAHATPYEHRLAMVRLAIAGDSRIAASTLDAPRDDGAPNYTFDVLHRIKAALAASDELFLLIGADAFLALKHWYRGTELPLLSDLIVAGRPGFPIDAIGQSLPDGLSASRDPRLDRPPGVIGWELHNPAGRRSALYLMPDLREDISATEVRAALAGEHTAAGVLAPPVLRYIGEHRLYRQG